MTSHGTSAALLASTVRGAVDMLVHNILDNSHKITEELPGQSLELLNKCVFRAGQQSCFMTMLALVVDFKEEKIWGASAGHTPPVLLTPSENKNIVKFVPIPTGLRLGIQAETKYQTHCFEFHPQQQLFMYTNGLIEGENSVGKEYGSKKLRQSLESSIDTPTEKLLEKVVQDAFSFFDGVPFEDDIALLLLKFSQSAQ